MIRRFRDTWSQADPNLRKRLTLTYGLLIGFNVAVWVVLLLSARRYPVLLGLATLAFGFGLRHAVDPDHIAAIDNTTRKLMQEGKRPVGVGFFFSLGHSTVVIGLSAMVALSTAFVHHNLPQMEGFGSLLGTSISSAFLLIIGSINLLVLIQVLKTWRRVKAGGSYDESLQGYLDNRGLLARIFKPLLKTVGNSWNMYPIGILFGLGFDTASEVGLLAISGATAASGMPIWYILLLPLLFTAGMALVDTCDGVLMLGAYGWAYVKPVRKLYYNLNITLVSVVVALLIGGLEAVQVIASETGAKGGVFALAGNIPFNELGFLIIGIFVCAWLASILVYKIRRYDLLDSLQPQTKI